jgi:UTP-glucose-1-phosphate uridylyltransferase
MGQISQNTALLCQMERVRVLRVWLKNLMQSDAPSNLASIGRYVLTPDILTLAGPEGGIRRGNQLADAINIQAEQWLCRNRAA